MTEWITAFRGIVEAVPLEEYPDLAAELARAEMAMRQNMTATAKPERPKSPDRWIDATEAGELCGMRRSWAYEHRDELGGRKMGGAVRYPVQGVQAYLEKRGHE